MVLKVLPKLLCHKTLRCAFLSFFNQGEAFTECWPEKRLDAMREAVAKKAEFVKMRKSWDVESNSWTAKSTVIEEFNQGKQFGKDTLELPA